MTDPRRRYVEQIRQSGVPLPPELAAAFAGVPREAFVPDGFQRRGGGWIHPADPDFLSTVYSDDVLVTKVDGRTPISSSSQPSLMAVMIMALQVRPGMHILEIGAGTGYNAALLATLGATVTSIDVQADVAAGARSAVARAGIAGVRVEHADGYAGLPGEHFDRVIVTVGIGGISPSWLDQLDPGGFVIAPVKHAGTHPVLAVAGPPLSQPSGLPPGSASGPGSGPPPGPVTATVVCSAGFMLASGPLNADHPESFPPPVTVGSLTGLRPFAPARFDPPLDELTYRNLWYAAGAWDRRATHTVLPDSDQSRVALLDEPGTGGAVILPDGAVLASDPDSGSAATRILDQWTEAGRPSLSAWRVGLTLTGDPVSPIWAPTSWRLRHDR